MCADKLGDEREIGVSRILAELDGKNPDALSETGAVVPIVDHYNETVVSGPEQLENWRFYSDEARKFIGVFDYLKATS